MTRIRKFDPEHPPRRAPFISDEEHQSLYGTADHTTPAVAPDDAGDVKEAASNLDNSALLDIHRVSGYPEVRRAIDTLAAELAQSGSGGHEKLAKKHVQLVVLNLYACWLADCTRYVAYSRRSNDFLNKNSRYNKLHISRKIIDVVDGLRRLGYVEHHTGFYDRRAGGGSRLSRIRAMEKLIALIRGQRVEPHMIDTAANRECIILRDRDPQTGRNADIEYEDTDDTRRIRRELYAYNNLLRTTHIDLIEKPGLTIPKFDPSNKFVRRIFNDGRWDHGGRFYGGWWQNLPKELRPRIRINGQPVIERDYSAMHVILLYAMEGMHYQIPRDGDPYSLQGYEAYDQGAIRAFLKMALLVLINAADRVSALKAINSELTDHPETFGWIRQAGLKIADIIDAFRERHGPIKDHFYSGMGIKLQRVDSQIAERVINTLTADGIPCLCLHDSFITQGEDDYYRLRDVMDAAFVEVAQSLFGIDLSAPKVKPHGRVIHPFMLTEDGDGLEIDMDVVETSASELEARGLFDDKTALEERFRKFKALGLSGSYYTDQ